MFPYNMWCPEYEQTAFAGIVVTDCSSHILLKQRVFVATPPMVPLGPAVAARLPRTVWLMPNTGAVVATRWSLRGIGWRSPQVRNDAAIATQLVRPRPVILQGKRTTGQIWRA